MCDLQFSRVFFAETINRIEFSDLFSLRFPIHQSLWFFFLLFNKACLCPYNTIFRHCRAYLQHYVEIEIANMNRLKQQSIEFAAKKMVRWSGSGVCVYVELNEVWNAYEVVALARIVTWFFFLARFLWLLVAHFIEVVRKCTHYTLSVWYVHYATVQYTQTDV